MFFAFYPGMKITASTLKHYFVKMKSDPPHPIGSAPPIPACPGCGMKKNRWLGDGYSEAGQIYCCQGCAEETGCYCKMAGSTEEISRREERRAGRQPGGALAPAGELSGERDAFGTLEG